MGRWTLHLSVGLGLLAVLLTCCYAEGTEDQNHNYFFVTTSNLLKFLFCVIADVYIKEMALILLPRFLNLKVYWMNLICAETINQLIGLLPFLNNL